MGELSFPLFMETVLQLRGSNNATVKDIVDLRKFMAQELWNAEMRLHDRDNVTRYSTHHSGNNSNNGSHALCGHPLVPRNVRHAAHRSASQGLWRYGHQ